MPFSLRLDPETEAIIRRLSAATGKTRASVVREAVAHYATRQAAGATTKSAFERVRPYVGIAAGGGANLSTDTHATYREQLRRKHRRDRSAR